jgi:hypothetical protein
MHGRGDCRRQVGLIEGFGELGQIVKLRELHPGYP